METNKIEARAERDKARAEKVNKVVNETVTNVEDILTPTEEVKVEEVKVVEPLNEVVDKIAIRMTSGYKWMKSWDDYMVTKKELKAIPKFKYKLI